MWPGTDGLIMLIRASRRGMFKHVFMSFNQRWTQITLYNKSAAQQSATIFLTSKSAAQHAQLNFLNF